MLDSMWSKRNLHKLLMRMYIGAANVDNNMESLQNIKNRTTV